ncbi:MAG: acyl carrier protein [Bacteroidaceae bacterium]|jgi:acyl carrier protein|nr:acyl carrier protein [Bacteroidaceae bacterium]
MELNVFIEKFAEQFDDTELPELTAETKFKELDEWSSLVALSVIAMVDEECHISMSAMDIRESDTIEDLYNKIFS